MECPGSKAGSCGTQATEMPAWRTISPSSSCETPAIARSSEDLPLPLRPISATRSPASIEKSTPSSRATWPKARCAPATVTSGIVAARARQPRLRAAGLAAAFAADLAAGFAAALAAGFAAARGALADAPAPRLLAAMRMRSAFSLMKPPASAWS